MFTGHGEGSANAPTDESGEELEEEDFGPEGDGGRIDEDVVAPGSVTLSCNSRFPNVVHTPTCLYI